ncbi:MAG: ribosomal L7Ae/L30e/S12e/Gadd45 family protein [Oscillospiraceae bacterium]|nr:ribosomal L7Ae/L30e/S12e/Gadd45 family protein [Oscillospiraceae bacterium]
MQSELLRFLGLMRRAGKLSVGEEGTGQAARAGKAKLILLARDASDNARDRAEGFARRGAVPLVRLRVDKASLASALGVAGGAMAAVCDAGFARALLEKFPEDTERIDQTE